MEHTVRSTNQQAYVPVSARGTLVELTVMSAVHFTINFHGRWEMVRHGPMTPLQSVNVSIKFKQALEMTK